MTKINSKKEKLEKFEVKFINPEEVIRNLEITSGMKVADFGCGAGHFSLALARKIGESGVVYSLDILPEKLEAVASIAKSRNFTNIITRRANLEKIEGSKIDPDSLDWVIIKDMLFQNTDKSAILAEAKRVLKKGGKNLVIEWNMANEAIGPERQLRLSKEAIISIAQQSDFGFLKEIPAGNFHCGMLFVK